MTFRKSLKCIEIPPPPPPPGTHTANSPVLQYPQFLHTPKNIHFSENPNNIEIKNFKPPKMIRAYIYMQTW